MRLLLPFGLLLILSHVALSQATDGERAEASEAATENQVKLLLELGKSMLRTAYLGTTDRDSAAVLFRAAQALSDTIGNWKLEEESQCLLGVVCLLNGDWDKGEAHFMRVISARQRAGDKA